MLMFIELMSKLETVEMRGCPVKCINTKLNLDLFNIFAQG